MTNETSWSHQAPNRTQELNSTANATTTDDVDVFATYLHSLYQSTLILTTVGNLPEPKTKPGYVFVIIEFVFGLLLFAAILGHVANIVTSISAARKEFQGKVKCESIGFQELANFKFNIIFI